MTNPSDSIEINDVQFEVRRYGASGVGLIVWRVGDAGQQMLGTWCILTTSEFGALAAWLEAHAEEGGKR